MSVLEQLRSPTPRALYAPWDNFWYQDVGYGRASGIDGVVVTPETAMRHSAVWACIGIRCEAMASLPLLLYKRLTRGKERAPDHDLYRKLRWQPNGWQTAFEFEEMAEIHQSLRGNFYARIVDDPFGQVAALIPLHPDRMKPGLLPAGRMQYEYRPPNGGPTETLSQDQVHHRRGRSLDGIVGISPVEYCAYTLGVAIAGDRYAGQWFNGAGSTPTALKHPMTLGEDGQKNLRDSIAKYNAGLGNAHKFLILEEGMDAVSLGVNARDAQLLESRQFGVEEIARIWNIPTHMLKVNRAGTVSYASVEMFDLEFVIHTVRPQATRNEQAIWRDLLSETDQDDYFPEYLLEALLRGDSAARAAFYKAGIESQWLVPNEARERENLNPLPGGDEVVQGKVGTTPGPQAPADQTPRTPTGKPRGEGDARARLITLEASARVVQKEIAAATKAATKFASDPTGWHAWCGDFYADHAGFIGHVLKLPSHHAHAYAAQQRDALATRGLPAAVDWESRVVPQLAALALGEAYGTDDTHL